MDLASFVRAAVESHSISFDRHFYWEKFRCASFRIPHETSPEASWSIPNPQNPYPRCLLPKVWIIFSSSPARLLYLPPLVQLTAQKHFFISIRKSLFARPCYTIREFIIHEFVGPAWIKHTHTHGCRARSVKICINLFRARYGNRIRYEIDFRLLQERGCDSASWLWAVSEKVKEKF